jgi:hypothetical protein
MTVHTPNGPAPEPAPVHTYTLRLAAPRPLSYDELLDVSQAAAAAIARICELPAGEVVARVEPRKDTP